MSRPGAARRRHRAPAAPGRAARALPALVASALVLPALVLAAAPAAAAPTAPADGAQYDAHTAVRVTASYGSSAEENRLTVAAPGQQPVLVARADPGLGGGTLEAVLDTTCWTADCAPAPNGTWTVAQSGGGTGSSTFTTRIPPAPPTSLEATPVSTREVRLTWTRGAEPDLVGFTVSEGEAVVADGLTTDACSGSTCSTVVRYASEGTGAHTYSVRARRSTAPGSCDALSSASSEPATARLEPPPRSEPSPDDSSSGGESAAPGGGTPSAGSGTGEGGSPGPGDGSADPGAAPGTTSPGGPGAAAGPGGATPGAPQTPASRRAFAAGFRDFGPKLGIPKLPPLPQAPAPDIAPELADGGFEGTLGFQDQVLREQVEVAQGPGARVVDVVGTALDSERLATSTAGALVLLLAGAHLRRWSASTPED